MKQKKKVTGRVISQNEIAPDIFDMWIETGLGAQARPGQFVMVYPKAESTLLPRPISICEAEQTRLRMVYRVAGKGTREFSAYQAGEEIAVMGTLGNGFPVEEAVGRHAVLLGGGIGIPPLVQLAKALPGEKTILAGYRDDRLFLKEELAKLGDFPCGYGRRKRGDTGQCAGCLAGICAGRRDSLCLWADAHAAGR